MLKMEGILYDIRTESVNMILTKLTNCDMDITIRTQGHTQNHSTSNIMDHILQGVTPSKLIQCNDYQRRLGKQWNHGRG